MNKKIFELKFTPKKEMNKYIKTGLVIFFFFIYPFFTFLPFKIFDGNIAFLPNSLKILYLISFNIIFLGILLIAYNKEMIRYYDDFKINGKTYISKTIRYWYLGLFIMILSNFIINTFTANDLAENEQAVRELLNIVPIYMLFSTIIYAPIVEEIICRQALKDIIKGKWSFIIISSIFFGSAHVLNSMTSLSSLLYIIPYGALGGVFAYAFYKTNNLFTAISLHAIHNGILISLYLLIF